jgi:hypothetical protein
MRETHRAGTILPRPDTGLTSRGKIEKGERRNTAGEAAGPARDSWKRH